jgi:structural maintenance of chromosome 4
VHVCSQRPRQPGPDAFEVVPDSTIVVARTAYTNNSSKYTINGGASTFTDVRALLLGRGIDLQHKRFLILQGEVESIALMKPKGAGPHDEGLLEYLEDIIGTAGYQAPIAAALAALDALAEERADKLARLRITERERAALAAEKREAEEHLRLVNAHTRAQSRLWQWYIWRAFTNLDVYQANIVRVPGARARKTLTARRRRRRPRSRSCASRTRATSTTSPSSRTTTRSARRSTR